MAGQIGSLNNFTSGSLLASADMNANFTDVKDAFNALMTAANELVGGLTVDGALTVGSGGFTVTAGGIAITAGGIVLAAGKRVSLDGSALGDTYVLPCKVQRLLACLVRFALLFGRENRPQQ